MNVAGPRTLHARVLFVLAISTAVPFLKASTNASAPSAADIIKRSVATNEQDWKAQPEYSYREQDTKGKMVNGHLKPAQSRTYEVMMIDGTPYNRLIGVNNEPLSPAQQKQEQSKLVRETKRRQTESHSAKQARLSKYQNERSEEHLLMQQMVQAFNFKLAGEERLEGVDCYVLNANPKPTYRPPVERAKVLTGMRGRLWIDKSAFHWVKVQAEVISPVEFGLFIAKVKPGTRFELVQAPVGEMWLPKSFQQSVKASVLGVYGLGSAEQDEYSDYQKTALSARR